MSKILKEISKLVVNDSHFNEFTEETREYLLKFYQNESK